MTEIINNNPEYKGMIWPSYVIDSDRRELLVLKSEEDPLRELVASELIREITRSWQKYSTPTVTDGDFESRRLAVHGFASVGAIILNVSRFNPDLEREGALNTPADPFDREISEFVRAKNETLPMDPNGRSIAQDFALFCSGRVSVAEMVGIRHGVKFYDGLYSYLTKAGAKQDNNKSGVLPDSAANSGLSYFGEWYNKRQA